MCKKHETQTIKICLPVPNRSRQSLKKEFDDSRYRENIILQSHMCAKAKVWLIQQPSTVELNR